MRHAVLESIRGLPWLRAHPVEAHASFALTFLLSLLLTAYPIARLELGRMPLYLIDVLAGLVLTALVRLGIRVDRFGRAVFLYLALWIPAWIVQVATLGIFLEPTYGLIRNVLAVGCFFIGLEMARRHYASRLAPALVGGVLVTSILAFAQEAWFTRQVVHDFLVAAAPAFAPASYRTYPYRAFAFFEAATLLSGFLSVMALVMLGCLDELRGRLRILAGSALLLIGPALIATYSRQSVPALAVGLLIRAVLRPDAIKRDLALVTLSIGLGLGALGTGVLDRAYLEQRWSRLGSFDVNTQIRLEGAMGFVEVFVRPLTALANLLPVPRAEGGPRAERRGDFSAEAAERPWLLVVGRGFAIQDLDHRGLVDNATAERLRSGENDNAFLMEVLNHGPLAGLGYAALLLMALARGVRAGRRPGPHRALVAGLAPALAAAVVLHFLDHYFSEAVFMKALLWLFVGLMLGLAAHAPDRESVGGAYSASGSQVGPTSAGAAQSDRQPAPAGRNA